MLIGSIVSGRAREAWSKFFSGIHQAMFNVRIEKFRCLSAVSFNSLHLVFVKYPLRLPANTKQAVNVQTD